MHVAVPDQSRRTLQVTAEHLAATRTALAALHPPNDALLVDGAIIDRLADRAGDRYVWHIEPGSAYRESSLLRLRIDEARIAHERDRRKLEVDRERVVEQAMMEKSIAVYRTSLEESAARADAEVARARAAQAAGAIRRRRTRRSDAPRGGEERQGRALGGVGGLHPSRRGLRRSSG